MKKLKAIETMYKGYLFRSRLEARWAMFFEFMGIDWQYEAEGYDLDGIWYLPDFWLPTFNGGMYVEVKPLELSYEEYTKAKKLVEHSKRPVWLAVGVPDMKAYTMMMLNNDEEVVSIPAVPLIREASRENRMYVWPMHEIDRVGYLKDLHDPVFGKYSKHELYPKLSFAVVAAKSSRF